MHSFQPPLGFWDPLGLLKDADQERFDRLRYVETKHGRIAMLAILGHLVTSSGYRLPGEIAYGIPFSSIKVSYVEFFKYCIVFHSLHSIFISLDLLPLKVSLLLVLLNFSFSLVYLNLVSELDKKKLKLLN